MKPFKRAILIWGLASGVWSLTACAGLSIERHKIGTIDPVHEAQKLEENRTTLSETLARLGPPDILLREQDVDRLYYSFWDSDYWKFILSADLTITRRGASYDLFVWSSGSEILHLARLDFDARGLLVSRQTYSSTLDRGGEFAGLDNSFIEEYVEDRSRALGVSDESEEEED